MFHPESDIKLPELNEVELNLLERDCIRSSSLRVSGFGAEEHTVHHDILYKARDRDQNSEGASKAFTMANSVYGEPTVLPFNVSSQLRDIIWDKLSHDHKGNVLGFRYSLQLSNLRYDAELLQTVEAVHHRALV